MPEIEIRPAISDDIKVLMDIAHSYSSERAWQMEIKFEGNKTDVRFREIHLPRSVNVDYPRPYKKLADDWTRRSGLLVAVLDEETIGYIGLMLDMAPDTTWVTDLVVARRLRRQGIGSTLVLAAQEWGRQHDTQRIVLEMQPKNYPSIKMVKKLGFDLCGYNDRYYENNDIALFFSKSLH